MDGTLLDKHDHRFNQEEVIDEAETGQESHIPSSNRDPARLL
jgi:hypothetical protein